MRVDGRDEDKNVSLRLSRNTTYELGTSQQSLVIPKSPVTVSRKKPVGEKKASKNALF